MNKNGFADQNNQNQQKYSASVLGGLNPSMYQGGKNNSAFIHSKAATNMNTQTMRDRKNIQNSVLSGGSNKLEKLGYQNFDRIGDLRNIGSI